MACKQSVEIDKKEYSKMDQEIKHRRKPCMGYLGFKDYGCQDTFSFEKTTTKLPFLSGYRQNGDTLILSIRYEVNCCPAFVDSVSIDDHTVDITIADTLGICDCICVFDNPFAFLSPQGDTLSVRFGWKGRPFELDTILCNFLKIIVSL